MYAKKVLAGLALVPLLLVTGCGHHSKAVVKASASAHAIATSTAVTGSENAAIQTALACLVTAGAIQHPSDVTYTVHPLKVTGANYTHHVITDPGGTTTKLYHCEQGAYRGHGTAIRNCLQARPPALGHGFFGRAFVAFVNCTAKYSGGTP